jgi:uncharacterized membrane protein YhhN
MLALLAWLGARAWQSGAHPSGGAVPVALFALGLGLSLAGDIFLMLPPRFFLAGLVAFLLGHVAYIGAFMAHGLPPAAAASLAAVPVALAGAWIGRRVVARLTASGKLGLRGPVVAYVVVISLMVISALATLARPDWPKGAAVCASLGALLFFVSDALLAWNRWIQPLPGGRLMNITTYHVGQLLLTAGFALRYLA